MTRSSLGRAREIRVSLPLCRSGLGLGTGVLTAEGELPVEFLEPGDRIVTFDRGLVRLSRVDARDVSARDVVRIRPAVLDPEGAGRDFLVSRRQQVLVRDWRARILWHKPVALVEAGEMIDGAHIAPLGGERLVRLFQLIFDDRQHLVQTAGGKFQLASARMPVTTGI